MGDSSVWNSGVCGAAYNVQALSVCVRVRCAFLFRVSRGDWLYRIRAAEVYPSYMVLARVIVYTALIKAMFEQIFINT